jgi:hypothetical protein
LVEAFYQTENKHGTIRHNKTNIKTKQKKKQHNTIENILQLNHFFNVKRQSERKKARQ